MPADLIVTTGNDVANRPIAANLGVVRGIVVRTPNIGQAFVGGLRSVFGGNIIEYTRVCEAARQEAFDLMVAHGIERGAHAIVGMRYDATEFTNGATEVLAYGTAVTLG